MNKKIFPIILILIFITVVMIAGRIFGQSDWNNNPDPKLSAQNQEPAYPPFDGPKLGIKPNLDKLEYWLDLKSSNLNRYKLSEQFQKMDLRDKYDILITCTFDSLTPWPSKDKMPPNFDPKKIMEIRKNPGLGIRDLHKQGITGKGVNVAIIDQPALLEHEEYKIDEKNYTVIECKGVDPQLHGPAVASILAGKNCGVAPDSLLHYYAVPMWEFDCGHFAKAIEEILDYNNKTKLLTDKIRVVSISLGFDSTSKNFELWGKIIEKAKNNGLIVITTGSGFGGAGCSLYPLNKDRENPANYEVCYFARGYKPSSLRICVPIDNRTYAEETGKNEYSSEADGGFSWGAPYLAGVMALGFQVDPNLKEDDIYRYLKETGTPFKQKINGKEYDLGWIVNPKGFVDRVKLELENKLKKPSK